MLGSNPSARTMAGHHKEHLSTAGAPFPNDLLMSCPKAINPGLKSASPGETTSGVTYVKIFDAPFLPRPSPRAHARGYCLSALRASGCR
jgi:hypothetical protein